MEIPSVPTPSSASPATATIGISKDGALGSEDQRVAADWLIAISSHHHARLQVRCDLLCFAFSAGVVEGA